jgi:hypothetical protein
LTARPRLKPPVVALVFSGMLWLYSRTVGCAIQKAFGYRRAN